MKFVHLSDLHLGKRVNEFSMIEDQQYILGQILEIIAQEKPDAVLIAGDVYDKSIPSAEATNLFSDFLTSLANMDVETFVISGNHDGADRLSFCNELISKAGVHISSAYDGHIEPVVMQDEYGDVNIYSLPFVKPSVVRSYFPEEDIENYTDAVDVAINEMGINPAKRNVIVAHQFVTGAVQGGSEEIYVGALENVDASVFIGFDYVALGHIHGPQKVGSNEIRYGGTPLKYSFSEANQKKSVTVVELDNKGEVEISFRELTPLHDMVELKGKYNEIISRPFYENTTYPNDYVHITLTDEEDVPDAIGKLRAVYPFLVKLDYDNARTRSNQILEVNEKVESMSPLELFADFYETQNNQPMTPEQSELMTGLIKEIWEAQQ
ncbi:MAG: exonuclease SbcCD subunit D [Eggerthellaceae bacterium]|nr:exonuclease SbcCD subunit D [Eggerthellaceae bacterium]